nr:PREDICTED: uncharacterized protein LOC105667552 [Linepithema humile]
MTACTVVKEIERLGFEISPQKTEAIIFPASAIGHGSYNLIIKNKEVPITSTLKYLGIILDSDWKFTQHFEKLYLKVNKIISYLREIMPNCRGPNKKKRKLYLHVVLSMILYGAPVWSVSFEENRRAKTLMVRLMRRITQRVCCAYRTVSFVAASIIPGTPPLEFQARRLAALYFKTRSAINDEEENSPSTIVKWKIEAKKQALLD